ncbi:MAG: hypothetical protein IJ955_10200, partial [Oscillospiraceae bacterium]|nr:hypothetical protein [Oscillospiraceae bacterium]
TAIAKGSVTVKATAKDGSKVTATLKITVTEAALFEGKGTKSDPFLIRNLTDLMNLQKVLNKSGYYFKQVADIDCSSVEAWEAIGDDDKPFKHSYDGGGYKISNLQLTSTYTETWGDTTYTYYNSNALFGTVEKAEFKNINIINAYTKDGGSKGQIAALAVYATNCTFKNCYASVDFISSGAGGLVVSLRVSPNQKTVMEDCRTEGRIQSGDAGGMVGIVSNEQSYYPVGEWPTPTVRDCSSAVKMEENGGGNVGGLIGVVANVNVYHCYATGDVYCRGRYMGGLIGEVQYSSEIAYCYATGNVYGNYFDLQYATNYGAGAFAGGLIGSMWSNAILHDSYATGDVYSNATYSNCQDNTSYNGGLWIPYRNPAGSLIGCLEVKGTRAGYGKKFDVYNCYATGTVTAPNACKGSLNDSYFTYCNSALIGLVYDDDTRRYYDASINGDPSDWASYTITEIGQFDNNYNLQELRDYYIVMPTIVYKNGMQAQYKEMPTYQYVEIITKDELKDQSTFEGWDFQNVWKMTANGPVLR